MGAGPSSLSSSARLAFTLLPFQRRQRDDLADLDVLQEGQHRRGSPLISEERFYLRGFWTVLPAGPTDALPQRSNLRGPGLAPCEETAAGPGHTTSTCPTGSCLSYCTGRPPLALGLRGAGNSARPEPFTGPPLLLFRPLAHAEDGGGPEPVCQGRIPARCDLLGALSSGPAQQSLCEPSLPLVEQRSRWCEAALCHHDSQGCWLECSQGGSSHAVDSRLALAVDSFLPFQ